MLQGPASATATIYLWIKLSNNELVRKPCFCEMVLLVLNYFSPNLLSLRNQFGEIQIKLMNWFLDNSKTELKRVVTSKWSKMTWSLSSLYDLLRKPFFNQLTCWLSNTNLIPRGTLGLCCALIGQLMTHTANLHMALYLAIMLLKPLGILQRVTKSQRVHHISNKKTENKKLNFKRFFAKRCFFYICGY